jgi:F0F1-type ATP synthase assembly protein I
MPVDMANQHTKGNSKGRVHMPVLYSKKRQLQRAIARTILFLIKTAVSSFIAWLISLWAIPAAYAERGYSAVGGEWILIIATFCFTYWAITAQLRRMIRKAREV